MLTDQERTELSFMALSCKNERGLWLMTAYAVGSLAWHTSRDDILQACQRFLQEMHELTEGATPPPPEIES